MFRSGFAGLALLLSLAACAAEEHVSGQVVADLSGEVRLLAEYPTKYPERNLWDISAGLDLSKCRGIEFDFRCDDPGEFSGFGLYFKSGDGWYSKGFEYTGEGGWQHVVLDKTGCGRWGKPTGWDKISTVRVSAWRYGHRTAHLAIAHVKPYEAEFCDVLIVRADSEIRRNENMADAICGFVRNVKETLDLVGVDSTVVSDRTLDAEELSTAKVVILPYNPKPAEPLASAFRDYIARGGKVVCTYGGGVTDLLGVKVKDFVQSGAGGRPKIAGFLKTADGLPGQPEFAPQASGFTTKTELPSGSRIIAEWADAERRPIGLPALALVPGGACFGHVWMNGKDPAKCDLMRALLVELAPSIAPKLEKRRQENLAKAKAFDAWVASRPSKPNEFRAYWCHSPKGMRGHDWDESVRVLKEGGFNALLANLSWGDAAFYESKVLPLHKDYAENGDMLVKCLAACRRYGVACHAWRVCLNCSGASPKERLDALERSGRMMMGFNGKRVGNWLCPSNPENKRQEVEAILEMAGKGVDGVHVDYIRYEGVNSCFCPGCRTRFERRIGRAIGDWPAAVRQDAELAKAWKAFRCEQITDIVRESAARVHAQYPGVAFSAAVGADGEKTPDDRAQDWYDWCRKGYLDFVCPMTYTDSTQSFWARTRSEREVLGDFKIRPGIGISCWKADGADLRRSIEQIEAVRKEGLDGFVFFALDGRGVGVLPELKRSVTRD